ncbi:c-type cytochrome biogenesis protein CcmI [Nitrogeniibacter mangrovi]|uniref:C-type cytochrome biogenesis protein CcmI n=1 Tax=Nitrogeniibacter mangrovi TaxID=2016596 RepID=A0A6C1BAY2_9RHOO|nr:c-type cytochrome biogenesis protein CcmI [Nitrogeniibacter mangrovi]QID19434.1 c-type cytochrome biogenesis protein CcmI [Nitrogeniibacter mangrovi]
MTVFIVIAALLVVGALVLLVPPLFGFGVRRLAEQDVGAYQARSALAVLREQLADLDAELAAERISEDQYQRTREELERRALDEGQAESAALAARPARAWALALVVLVPLVAALVYLQTGSLAGLDPAKTAVPEGGQQITQEQVEQMVANLAERLKSEPDNAEGWFMLARSYNALGRFDEAATAYATLAKLVPDEAQVYADWADALAASKGRNLAGEPEQLIDKALALDPNNVKAIALKGSAAFQQGDYAQASSVWERILTLLPPDNELAQSIRQGIAEARQRGHLPPLAAVPAPAAGGGAGVTLSGELSLAPELAGKVSADDTLFVFVRPVGGGMPFAILRHTVADLPLKFDFKGVPSMAGNRPIPAQVVIGARISKSGNASAGAGDVEAAPLTVKPDAAGVKLVLNQELGGAAAGAAPAPMAAAGGISLSGELSLAPELAQKAAPNDVVFIFVRPVNGGMPFAVLRHTVADLPLKFDFNGVPSMAGNRPIPAQVAIGARVSKSGRAGAAAGDLEAPSVTVKPDASGVNLVLKVERTS